MTADLKYSYLLIQVYFEYYKFFAFIIPGIG